MSRRRFLWAIAIASTAWLGACTPAPTKLSVTQSQLEQGLAAHFPKQFPIAGLLQLEVQPPQLQLLPVSNQLQTTLAVQLSGPSLRRSFTGQMQVRLGLYYQAEDRSVRAERVQVLSLTLPELSPAMADMVQTYGMRIAEQALQTFALYTVPAQELELLQRFALQPGAITVTEHGLDMALVPRTPAQP